MLPSEGFKSPKKFSIVFKKEMAGVADAVVVFWDGYSLGTQHMITIAKDHRLPLKVVTFDSPA